MKTLTLKMLKPQNMRLIENIILKNVNSFVNIFRKWAEYTVIIPVTLTFEKLQTAFINLQKAVVDLDVGSEYIKPACELVVEDASRAAKREEETGSAADTLWS
jgi:hypothetical protein